ncbi:4047_t:CDS:2 [Cetraspora pellucida]|uniref:4047_t:CDS:1 n=1 Tax=Cetraspora pellucida TaxID=1433469 RepID=A0ACA9KTB4_9GLOM|nr:4047_t:CDS:2 [Cetraspora pellucida]
MNNCQADQLRLGWILTGLINIHSNLHSGPRIYQYLELSSKNNNKRELLDILPYIAPEALNIQ